MQQRTKAHRDSSMLDIRCRYRNERGVVLTTSLVLLAVLTLMGAMAILNTITDTQISTNLNGNREKALSPSRETYSHPYLFQSVDEVLPDPQCRRDLKGTNDQI